MKKKKIWPTLRIVKLSRVASKFHPGFKRSSADVQQVFLKTLCVFEQATKCPEAQCKQMRKEGKGNKQYVAEALSEVDKNIFFTKSVYLESQMPKLC